MAVIKTGDDGDLGEDARSGAAGEAGSEAAWAPALLSRQIAQTLRTMIATDDLPPGARLRERTLAERLQVSRTPLREALNILRGDGLVTLTPNRGAVVTVLSSAQVQEKLAVLGLIEGFGGELACQNASEDEIAEIRALHYDMAAAFERRDRAVYFRTNQAIHRAIQVAAHNTTLLEVFEQINRQIYRYRYQGSLNAQTWHTALAEHEEIIRLLSARAAEALGALLRAHVHSTWDKIDWAALTPAVK
ncbi:GntR family transcriptional regulator [Rhodospirillum rubrum]|nr:GntR family transcriptional regulator [Rhodospirillum rubrum]AEO49678.1 GntR family transcriptional regulator [Rhodospirillum rubrum F11]QXG79878.1 GntR family transcriptional regulator [Rhodospirillum rubrum]